MRISSPFYCAGSYAERQDRSLCLLPRAGQPDSVLRTKKGRDACQVTCLRILIISFYFDVIRFYCLFYFIIIVDKGRDACQFTCLCKKVGTGLNSGTLSTKSVEQRVEADACFADDVSNNDSITGA